MPGLSNLNAPLDSVALISLIEYIARAVTVAASQLLLGFCFVRVPASMGPSPLMVCFCALMSRLLWDSHLRVLKYKDSFPSFLEMPGLGDSDAPLDSVALISLIEYISRALTVAASQLLWETFCFVRVPASLGPSPLMVCFCALMSRLLWESYLQVLKYKVSFPSFLEMPGLGDFDAPLDSVALISLIKYISRALTVAASQLLWETFCFVRVPASLGPSPLMVCFCALMSRLLWESYLQVLKYKDSFPSFLEMPGLGDFDAPLDSVALISLNEYISRALTVAASQLLLETFRFVRVPASLGPSPLMVCFCALMSRLLWDSHLRVLKYKDSFPSFLEMPGLGDFDAPHDSVALISLIKYISTALTVAAAWLF